MSGGDVSIVGAGALGQTYATAFALGGASVSLVVRAATEAAISARGAIELAGVMARSVPVTRGPRAEGVALTRTAVRGSGIVFATKGQDLEGAARESVALDPEWVMGLQNGMAKDDILGAIFGRERVVGEVGTLAAERRDDGVVQVTNVGSTYVGELDGRISERARSIAATMSAGSIPTEATNEIVSLEWSKLVNVAGTFGVDLLARSVWSRSMEDRHLGRAFLWLLREAAAVARAEGARIRDLPGIPSATYLAQDEDASLALRAERVDRMRRAGGELDRKSSMLQDLLRGRPLEAEFVFGDLVSRAKRSDVGVPRLELVREIALGLTAGGSS